ncbi:hypothetical protein AQUCO_09300057v1 [Aquilegia coerulea]|uniref:Uncharacterized protein n=1 Tax=Aquilegia coerulea TaxID=218851 RepID=A0A2G5C5D0_AQUCA|nr:hypothetical protein AQUCO_09300057v1 [Aquilegia coerulea]
MPSTKNNLISLQNHLILFIQKALLPILLIMDFLISFQICSPFISKRVWEFIRVSDHDVLIRFGLILNFL